MIVLPDLQTDKLLAEKKIASVPLEVLALAGKKDAGKGRSSLQDLYFRTVCPAEYHQTKERMDGLLRKQGMNVNDIIGAMGEMLGEEDIHILDIHGRTKGVFSTYLKLFKYDDDMSRIHDLIAVRIIVDDIDTCYRTLKKLHASYLPVDGREKDYIATPKANGYQSLHSTVTGIGTGMLEVQIRTGEMHAHAEIGNAAHWAYDLAKSSRRIMDSLEERGSSGEVRYHSPVLQQETGATGDVSTDSSP